MSLYAVSLYAVPFYAVSLTFRPLARSHSVNSASPTNVKAATLTEWSGARSALKLPAR